MRFSEAKGKRVMSVSDARTVGKLRRLIIDPQSKRVVGLTLRKTPGDGDTVAWTDLQSFGRDAVTVESAERIVAATGDLERLGGKHRALIGRRVLTTDGDGLGEVADVEFDAGTGALVTIVTGTVEVPGDALIGLGPYAAVVDVPRPS